ncbi:DUF4260 family protein [Pseudacidovorax sp. RU35E]|uniref:DUF4260 family protein n=1 Tax=Pseudacidovorax sp. RU35E TaxID=1907403 RepID=UPI001F23AAA1|nr:DUF4260 family protein [Pseudacidovorax sp. RU35E]
MAEDLRARRAGWTTMAAGAGVEAAPVQADRVRSAAGRHGVHGADAAGAVHGGVRLLLRAEGAALLLFAVLAYAQMAPGQWGRFAALLLLPDLAMLGYLAGPAIGARAYNAAHSVISPVLLAGAGFATPAQATLLWSLAAIWLAHIGLDRLLGYGLKYGRGFGHSHLGRLGPRDPW